MRKYCFTLTLLACFISAVSFSQTAVKDSLPSADSLAVYDSILNDIRSLIGNASFNKSFFSFSLSAGNRLFSLRNNSINVQQATTNKICFTPSLAYNHKSGLGLSLTSFVTSDSGKISFYQYALSPYFVYLKNPKFTTGLYYTHYFTHDLSSFYGTPLHDELYAYINAAKGWLRPGISVGWAKGAYHETGYTDTAKYVLIRDTLRRIPIRIYDTTRTAVTDFSIALSVEHEFEWDGIFSRKDNLSVLPSLQLYAGGQHYDLSSKYKYAFRTLLGKRKYRNFNEASTGETGFRLQSLGLSLSATYIIGSFSFSPQYYLGYDLPETTGSRYSQLFLFSATMIF